MIQTELSPKKKRKVASLEEQLKTDFVTLSSHQLRTPLSAVKWFSEILISQKRGKLNRKQLDYLKEVHRSNERAIALVNDLLQVSRVEKGKLHLDLVRLDIAELFEEVINTNKLTLSANKMTYHFEIVNGPLPALEVDKAKVKRVMQNLFLNAIKYSPNGGHIDVVVKRTQKEVVCSISDSGLGIPIDQQDGIFQKFYRGGNAAKVQPDGTGLGLFIAKSFVEAHKGKIWFESEEGRGTSFYFSLPIKAK
ncbi:MAG: hypothetical protein COT91_04985 [Candidatus Doudnabacteria bacterium CG10_big_fil_rev_8_21_14_0_10_41_10]|uniref:histidine kinase n=1 Tax=Candidatus Doudnabacteria bacterium CG10_big_fil_rev_8_21_14_0_10_41_10 TaxID=1974551 RepID=A0A2H0VCB9_9BACT|nr:MAG: hypothetical protein COT91_04985 [Candidatus Doudnabacteria bacterium CG10_big_fil_rev_8_21_14_0_10_41_10]